MCAEDMRYQSLRDFTDQALRDVGNSITKAGGDKERFFDYLSHKEGIGLFDDAIDVAFEDVEGEIKYKGVL